MFYQPEKDDHGLPFNPYKSIVVPRPVGWISTISRDGITNLAPYSQFNNLGYDPPYVMFSANSFPSFKSSTISSVARSAPAKVSQGNAMPVPSR